MDNFEERLAEGIARLNRISSSAYTLVEHEHGLQLLVEDARGVSRVATRSSHQSMLIAVNEILATGLMRELQKVPA